MIETLIVASFLGGITGLFLLIRNFVVYRVRTSRIDWIHRENLRDIRESPRWLYESTTEQRWHDFNTGPSYDRMMFMLNKWTYRGFYP